MNQEMINQLVQNQIKNQQVMNGEAQIQQKLAAVGESNEKSIINGWVSYITVGTFRIDDGQSIEALYPANSLTTEEKKSIAMISFPDTQCLNQSNDLMIQYCFRMKIRECQQLGFVCFLRKKDPSQDRGYIQKSIVLITKLPLINFYQQILNHLGEIFYEKNTVSCDDLIHKAIEDIQSWPEPENSKLYRLEFLGQKYTISIPSYLLRDRSNQTQQTLNTNSSPLTEIIDYQNVIQNTNQVNIKNNQEQENNQNPQLSSDEFKAQQQLPKSISHQDFRLKNNIKLNENKFQRENNKQVYPNFFTAKHSNHTKINFQDKEIVLTEQPESNSDLPELEIRSKQRSNSLETEQEFSLQRQIKQKTNLSEILKLNDAQEEGLFQEINVFRHVQFNKLHCLWPIWEMVLTNQPFLLTTNTPSECSAAILGFISLISPLQFAGDYRPYFTVYDTEYKKINIEYEQNMLKNYILGTCNPLFQMTMKNFPVIVGFDSKSEKQQNEESKKSKKPIQPIKYNRVKVDIISDNKQLQKLLLNSTTPEAMAINNTLVRKHFRVLTNLFLEPINKYLEDQPNQTKVFEEKSFLEYLKKRKSLIQHLYKEKSQLYSLYERFLRSMNFLRFIRNKPNVVYQNPFAPVKKQ